MAYRLYANASGSNKVTTIEIKDICKMNIDLWIHQNTLMWSRLRILWFVQLGFLALAGYLFFPHSPQPALAPATSEAVNLVKYAKYASLLCAFTTFVLWIVMRTDRLIRNIYRKNIEALNLGFFPASLGQKPINEDKGTLVFESIFYYVIFLVFVSIDLYASSVFGLNNFVLLGFVGFFVLASLIVPFVEQYLARSCNVAVET